MGAIEVVEMVGSRGSRWQRGGGGYDQGGWRWRAVWGQGGKGVGAAGVGGGHDQGGGDGTIEASSFCKGGGNTFVLPG